MNVKQACLRQVEAEMLQLEESLNDEQIFIEKLATGDETDVIALNALGTMMVTTRKTLCTISDSALAQQFDNSKWTEQGCNCPPVNEWTPDQVNTWAKNVQGLPEEVATVLYENDITGHELLAMNIDGLERLGIIRAGTLCLLLKDIARLERTSLDFVTLI
jgi:hypothetical protein